jgi:hypothetical protein
MGAFYAPIGSSSRTSMHGRPAVYQDNAFGRWRAVAQSTLWVVSEECELVSFLLYNQFVSLLGGSVVQ